MLQTFFTQRTLKRHLITPRTLQEHLGTQETRALENLRHSGHRRALGHSGTQALAHLHTQRELGHSGTWALGHLGNRDTRGTLFSKLDLASLHKLEKSKCL